MVVAAAVAVDGVGGRGGTRMEALRKWQWKQ